MKQPSSIDQRLVDALHDLADAGLSISGSITTRGAAGGQDACGGHVESLTEAVMGMTSALVQIGQALNNIADAISNQS